MPDAEYISLPLETDPLALWEDLVDYLETEFPGWEAADGSLESFLLFAITRHIADVRDLTSNGATDIFRYYGATIADIPPIDANVAEADTTWTMIDNDGYTIPAGTFVGIPRSGNELIAFAVQEEVIVAPGNMSTAAGEVKLIAIEPGSKASGLSGTPQLIDALDYVSSIALVGVSTGGEDAESDIDYLNRLRDELKYQSPRPILPADFAALSRRIGGVHRATAIDGYNPSNATYNNERMVAVSALDESGNPVGSSVKAEIDAYLQAMREVNFVVNVIDRTANNIAVVAAVKALAGHATADVDAAVTAAVSGYLSGLAWGVPPGAAETEWENWTVVRYLEVAEVINRVDGVDYITSLTVNGGTANVTLTGAAPIPVASPAPAITVT